MTGKSFLIFQGLFLLCHLQNYVTAFSLHGGPSDKTPICCLPSECQAFVYEDFGLIAFGLIGYQNSSGMAAYSLTDKKMFFNQTGILSDLSENNPCYEAEFWDYDKGMQYYEYMVGECDTQDIGPRMRPACIWENEATLISKGWLGDEGVPIKTYRYVGPQGYNLTTTLFIDDTESPPLCRPIQHTMVGYNELIIELFSLNFVDIGPLQSKDVFKVPDACKNATSDV